MNSSNSTSGRAEPTAVITRVGPTQWDAVADGRIVGRGDASRRPDGRIFLSIDSWHGSVFDRLAAVMLPELSTPLYTVVDEVDANLRSAWERAGFTVRRREWEYFGSTDPRHTGLDSIPIPDDVRILPVGAAQEGPLLELYTTIRAEVDIVACPAGTVPIDPARYAVATRSGRYVGLLGVATRREHARIELVAVHADVRRRGIARALLADVLGALHGSGIETVSAYVNEADTAAVALFDGVGRRAGSNLELVRR
ncbi:GNAT family N-acetyltransferase [Nocardia pseudobrasiliensis]|uniref:Acetyltransferase (GNAT) family protein n=1 Tax=Nocardia pseudobrasiliensis TaxID=45979 RepID=A0A370IEX8_9NOCA|nr:GNAT family N-acetyltransferase [Nocardia pseudobrasiliensis]RDI69272.1 acetyltransferase (GNAT) family protein [Nocardia pseudobrasiliensis]